MHLCAWVARFKMLGHLCRLGLETNHNNKKAKRSFVRGCMATVKVLVKLCCAGWVKGLSSAALWALSVC